MGGTPPLWAKTKILTFPLYEKKFCLPLAPFLKWQEKVWPNIPLGLFFPRQMKKSFLKKPPRFGKNSLLAFPLHPPCLSPPWKKKKGKECARGVARLFFQKPPLQAAPPHFFPPFPWGKNPTKLKNFFGRRRKKVFFFFLGRFPSPTRTKKKFLEFLFPPPPLFFLAFGKKKNLALFLSSQFFGVLWGKKIRKSPLWPPWKGPFRFFWFPGEKNFFTFFKEKKSSRPCP